MLFRKSNSPETLSRHNFNFLQRYDIIVMTIYYRFTSLALIFVSGPEIHFIWSYRYVFHCISISIVLCYHHR